MFWPIISNSFLKCVNETFVKGEMSCFQKQAIITLIEKKGKDRSSLENYKLQNNFNLSLQQLTQFLQRPHTVALEPYVRAFQFIVLSGILYTNSKFYQVGYISSDLCSFCIRESESLYHLFLFLSIFKDFLVRFWIFLAPTDKWKNTIITARHY